MQVMFAEMTNAHQTEAEIQSILNADMGYTLGTLTEMWGSIVG